MAGVVHDAVQQAVMQYRYDDELYQAWRDGEIGEKDLPEEVMAMTFDLCERWRAEQARCAGAPTWRSGSPATIAPPAAAAVAAAPTLAQSLTVFGALGVQSSTAHPGPGSSEAHPAGRMIGIGLRAREP